MKPLTIWVADAFTSTPFSGNPAGVCIVSNYDDDTCQQIATEMYTYCISSIVFSYMIVHQVFVYVSFLTNNNVL